MKTLLLTVLALISFNSFAHDIKIGCDEDTLNTLRAAYSFRTVDLRGFIENEIIPAAKTCKLETIMADAHAAACGQMIYVKYKYDITLEDNKGNVEITVDASYRSCLRYRVIPQIKEFKFSKL